jgi:hypothetical protein
MSEALDGGSVSTFFQRNPELSSTWMLRDKSFGFESDYHY